MTGVETVLIAVLAAAIYSATSYLKKHMKDDPENFDPVKFAATLIVGAIVGFSMWTSGIPITQEAVETQLVAYAGLVAIVENVIKVIYRAFTKS